MIPASVASSPYLFRSPVRKIKGRRAHAYLAARKDVIIFKISVSLFVVSLNPGVSMKVTTLPSRVKSSASWTSAVHGSKPIPTGRFEPLARLINWRRPD